MEGNPVVWFEIYVQDMPRAKGFYEKVLNVTLQRLESPDGGDLEMWAFPMKQDGPGAAGALAKMEGAPSGGGTIVYFTSKDCAIEAARIAGSGGTLMKPKFSIGPYGFIALAVDPDGNVFGLHSMK
jgi:predicted enzyme related to lactoylglutathione lyase